MEPSPELEDGCDPAVDLDLAPRSVERSRQDLEQRALPGSVPPKNADHLTSGHFKAHVSQRPPLDVPGTGRQELEEDIDGPCIDLVHLRELLTADRRGPGG